MPRTKKATELSLDQTPPSSLAVQKNKGMGADHSPGPAEKQGSKGDMIKTEKENKHNTRIPQVQRPEQRNGCFDKVISEGTQEDKGTSGSGTSPRKFHGRN